MYGDFTSQWFRRLETAKVSFLGANSKATTVVLRAGGRTLRAQERGNEVFYRK